MASSITPKGARMRFVSAVLADKRGFPPLDLLHHPPLQLRAISRSIPMFMAEITQLLDKVPRQLVLILKTNDLLRGIELVLGARVQRQSYLTMSKYCLRAIGEHEELTSRSWTQWALCRTRTKLSILFVRLYETWLWWKAVLSF